MATAIEYRIYMGNKWRIEQNVRSEKRTVCNKAVLVVSLNNRITKKKTKITDEN